MGGQLGALRQEGHVYRTDEEMRPALRQEGHVSSVISFFPPSQARPSSSTTSGDTNAVVTEGTLARVREL
jgi:hypothetical protein